MTKRQRAQVVELLRCAADADGMFDVVGLVSAGFRLGYVDFVNPSATTYMVADQAAWSPSCNPEPDFRRRLLESALRVEQGWSP